MQRSVTHFAGKSYVKTPRWLHALAVQAELSTVDSSAAKFGRYTVTSAGEDSSNFSAVRGKNSPQYTFRAAVLICMYVSMYVCVCINE